MGTLPVIFILVMTSSHVWSAAFDTRMPGSEKISFLHQKAYELQNTPDDTFVSGSSQGSGLFDKLVRGNRLPQSNPRQTENRYTNFVDTIFNNVLHRPNQMQAIERNAIPGYPKPGFYKRDFWIPPTRYKRVRVCPFLNRVGFPLGGCLYSYIKPTYKPPPPPPPPKPTPRTKPIPRPVIMWQPYQARWPEFYFLGGALGR